jgi:hypothetical protein
MSHDILLPLLLSFVLRVRQFSQRPATQPGTGNLQHRTETESAGQSRGESLSLQRERETVVTRGKVWVHMRNRQLFVSACVGLRYVLIPPVMVPDIAGAFTLQMQSGDNSIINNKTSVVWFPSQHG